MVPITVSALMIRSQGSDTKNAIAPPSTGTAKLTTSHNSIESVDGARSSIDSTAAKNSISARDATAMATVSTRVTSNRDR